MSDTRAPADGPPPAAAEIARIYEALQSLLARDDLPPAAAENAQAALTALWNAVHGLEPASDPADDLEL